MSTRSVPMNVRPVEDTCMSCGSKDWGLVVLDFAPHEGTMVASCYLCGTLRSVEEITKENAK